MIERVTEKLSINLASSPVRCAFDLCRKPERFGDISIDQFWIERQTVYDAQHRNHQSIIDYFWSVCQRDGAAEERSARETYALALLVPEVRKYGSSAVFADSTLSRSGRSSTATRELDDALRESRNSTLTRVQFRDATGNLLYSEQFDQDAMDCYLQFVGELLGDVDVSGSCSNDGFPASVQARWRRWKDSIGRHRGKHLEKQVLDVISYECRAALHTCYSVAWSALIPHLYFRYGLSHESCVFHRFWHLANPEESSDTHGLFYLFHGHVFALHPAAGFFLKTAAGCELMADWLRQPDSEPFFGCLLNGLCVAINHYSSTRDSISLERRSAYERRLIQRLSTI
jgi:hypothetical protein